MEYQRIGTSEESWSLRRAVPARPRTEHRVVVEGDPPGEDRLFSPYEKHLVGAAEPPQLVRRHERPGRLA